MNNEALEEEKNAKNISFYEIKICMIKNNTTNHKYNTDKI